MIRLALQSLRFRPTSAIGTFLAIFLGATAVYTFGALMETGIRADVPPQRLASAGIVVTAPQQFEMPDGAPGSSHEDNDTQTATLPEWARIDNASLATIAGVPGVRAAIGDVSIPATVLHDGQPLGTPATFGHTFASTALAPYTLIDGGAPSDGGEIAVDPQVPGVGVGSQLTVMVGGVPRTYRVSGVVAPPAPTRNAAIFFDDATARQLSGHPATWDAIGVLTAPNIEPAVLQGIAGDIRSATGSAATVLTGGARGVAEFHETLGATANLVIVAAVAGGNAIAVAAFVIAATLGLTIQQRRGELALLRAVGCTPRQLRRLVIGETGVIALAAGVLGWLPGKWLAHLLFGQLVAHGVVPNVVVVRAGWIPMVVAAGAAVLAAVLAAAVVARRAAVVRPTEAIADAGESGRWLTKTRIALAAVAFAGGAALVIVTLTLFDGPIAASTAGPSVFLWAFGLAMISPGATRLMTALVHWPARLLGGTGGYLAVLNSRSRPVRVAGAVTPIMLATGLATAMIYLQTTTAEVEQRAFADSLRADAVISATTGVLAPDIRDRVAALPQVADASDLVTSAVFLQEPYFGGQDEEGMAAQGITADAAGAVVSSAVTGGSLTALRGNTVALPQSVAGPAGIQVGGTITIRMGDGADLLLTVAAITRDNSYLDTLLLPADLLAAHTSAGAAGQILLRAASGVQPAELQAALRSALRDAPGLTIGDTSLLIGAHHENQQVGAWAQYLILGVLIMYTVLAVVNSMIISTTRRRREFGLQRLTGSTRGQVLRMMSVEAILVAVIGVVLGTVVSCSTLVPFSLLTKGSVLPTGPLGIYLTIVGGAVVLSLSAMLLPAWRVTRGRPAAAALADAD
jgi:putative ABC transport system permease protein